MYDRRYSVVHQNGIQDACGNMVTDDLRQFLSISISKILDVVDTETKHAHWNLILEGPKYVGIRTLGDDKNAFIWHRDKCLKICKPDCIWALTM